MPYPVDVTKIEVRKNPQGGTGPGALRQRAGRLPVQLQEVGRIPVLASDLGASGWQVAENL